MWPGPKAMSGLPTEHPRTRPWREDGLSGHSERGMDSPACVSGYPSNVCLTTSLQTPLEDEGAVNEEATTASAITDGAIFTAATDGGELFTPSEKPRVSSLLARQSVVERPSEPSYRWWIWYFFGWRRE